MTSEQMAWGLAGILATGCGAFLWREVTSKDALRALIETNRIAGEQALDRIAGQMRAAIDALNSTMATLTQAVGKLDATMARDYASKDDLRELREDMRREMDICRESCPEPCPHITAHGG